MQTIDAICPDRSQMKLLAKELKWIDIQEFRAWVDQVFDWYAKDDTKYRSFARKIWLAITFDMWYSFIHSELQTN